MRCKTERNARTLPSLTAIEFFPVVTSRAQSRHVLEVYRQSGRAVSGYQTDDNAVAQRPGPVLVKLAILGRGCSRRLEGSGGFAKGVLIDSDQVLKDIS
jgi:hypothetical protein